MEFKGRTRIRLKLTKDVLNGNSDKRQKALLAKNIIPAGTELELMEETWEENGSDRTSRFITAHPNSQKAWQDKHKQVVQSDKEFFEALVAAGEVVQESTGDWVRHNVRNAERLLTHFLANGKLTKEEVLTMQEMIRK